MNLLSWSLYGVLCLVLAGCGISPVVSDQKNDSVSQPLQGLSGTAEQSSCHPDRLTDAEAQAGPFSAIIPTQALAASAKGQRVCWGGGLRTIEAVEGGRDCVVMLYAELSPKVFWGWPRDASFFKACGPGHYERALLQPFTLGLIGGKVTGQAEFGGSPIPVIEIEAFYRASDCLQGDTSPQCVHGHIQPQKKPQ